MLWWERGVLDEYSLVEQGSALMKHQCRWALREDEALLQYFFDTWENLWDLKYFKHDFRIADNVWGDRLIRKSLRDGSSYKVLLSKCMYAVLGIWWWVQPAIANVLWEHQHREQVWGHRELWRSLVHRALLWGRANQWLQQFHISLKHCQLASCMISPT